MMESENAKQENTRTPSWLLRPYTFVLLTDKRIRGLIDNSRVADKRNVSLKSHIDCLQRAYRDLPWRRVTHIYVSAWLVT